MHLLLSFTTAIESKQLRVYKHDIAYESMGKNVELFLVLACTNLIDEQPRPRRVAILAVLSQPFSPHIQIKKNMRKAQTKISFTRDRDIAYHVAIQ